MQREKHALWRKADAVYDLTTLGKTYRMTAVAPYQLPNPAPGQILLLAKRPFS
jgi:hypothetical protein